MKMVLGIAFCLMAAASAARECVERDIPYASPERCRLDVKWPEGKTNFPTVVWFHGGGLVSGGKHFIRIDESIAQVSVNYRLLKKGGMADGETCIRDAAAAAGFPEDQIYAAGYSMPQAVQFAHAIAIAGQVVLLSPACASFDMYSDMAHRGRDFKRLVCALPGKIELPEDLVEKDGGHA